MPDELDLTVETARAALLTAARRAEAAVHALETHPEANSDAETEYADELLALAALGLAEATGRLPAVQQPVGWPIGRDGNQAALPARPDGEYARVEIMGHDAHIGWVSDGTRAGVPVMVIRDWDNRVIAEVPGQSLYRFVPLPTPLKRPEPQRAITASASDYDPWTGDGDDDDDLF